MIVGNSLGFPLYNGFGMMSAVNSTGAPSGWPGDGIIRFIPDSLPFDTASAYQEYGYGAQPTKSPGVSPYLPEGWDYSATVRSYGGFTYDADKGVADWGAPYTISGKENGVSVVSSTMVNPQSGNSMFDAFYPEGTYGLIINAGNDGFSGLSSVRSAFIHGFATSIDARIRATESQFADETFMFGYNYNNLKSARIHWVGTGTADTTMMFYQSFVSSMELIADGEMNLMHSASGISSSGFAHSSDIRNLSIKAPSIGDMRDAFRGVFPLSSVSIDTTSIDNMAGAFSGCSSLKNVDMGNCFVNNADSTFYLCKSLSSLPITSYGSSTYGTYAYCKINVPVDIDISRSHSANWMFEENLYLPSAHIRLGTDIENLDSMFDDCRILSALKIDGPSRYPNLSNINSFASNTNLTGYADILKLISSCDGGVLSSIAGVFNSRSGSSLRASTAMNLVLPGTSGSYASLNMGGVVSVDYTSTYSQLRSLNVLFDNGGWVTNTATASARMYRMAKSLKTLDDVSISSNRAGKTFCDCQEAVAYASYLTGFSISPMSAFTITNAKGMLAGTRIKTFSFGGPGTDPLDFVSGDMSSMFNGSKLSSITVRGIQYTSLSAAIGALSASYSAQSHHYMFSGCTGFPDYSSISATKNYSSWIK